MKIAIDARLYGTEFTGLGRYTMNLVNELASLDKKNSYFILLRKDYYNKLKLPPNFRKIEADIPIYTLREQIILPLFLNKLNADIVHFPHLNVPIMYNKKFIVTVHDIIMQKQGKSASTLPLPIYLLKRLPFKLIFYHTINRSQKIITATNTVKQEITSYYNNSENKIEVIHHGVDKVIKKKVSKKISKDKYFLYVGNAYPHKNLKFLVKAIDEFNKGSDERVKLFIRTDKNEFRNRLERYVNKIKAAKYVKFLNRVSDEELGKMYNNSVAYVFPSLTEGFGLPGLEAIYNDTLLLAANTPVFREVYRDQAIYFDPYDTSSLVNKMKYILDMSDKDRIKRVKKSKSLLKIYSWEKMAKETLNVYETM